MIDSTEQLDEFASLAAEYLDGRASEAGIERLRRGLREEAACREIYVAVCLQSRLMRETLAERIASTDIGPLPARGGGRIWRIGVTAAAIAALLAIVAGAAAVYLDVLSNEPARPVTPGPTIAVMLDSDGAEWLTEPIAPGTSVSPRAVALAGGSAEFELSSGVSLTMAGPAALTLDSGRRATLRRGLVIADVPRGAEGFAVDVPGGGRVVDLGTRFAVLVDEAGRSFVYVLEGVVEYSGPIGSAGSIAAEPIRATAGRGLLIGADGSASESALAGVPEAMRGSLRRFEAVPVRAWSPAQDVGSAAAPGAAAAARIERPFDGVDVAEGLTIEAAFRVDDAARWNNTTNWTLLRQEHAHRVLLALQASAFIGAREGRAAAAAASPGISFGLFTGGYGELDIALDGEEGRPRFADLLDGRVHHVAAVYDAARMEKAIYLDGRLIGRETLAAGATLRVPTAPAAPATIGHNNGGELFDGRVLSVAIYDGPMPRRQIEQRAELWLRPPTDDANETGPTPAVEPEEDRNTH